MKFTSARTKVATTLAILVGASTVPAGCGAPGYDEESLDAEEPLQYGSMGSDIPSFEDYKAEAQRGEGDMLHYVVDYDIILRSEEQLRDYYDRFVLGLEPKSLIMTTSGPFGQPITIRIESDTSDLTWCVQPQDVWDAVGAQNIARDALRKGLEDATRRWSLLADLVFREVQPSSPFTGCVADIVVIPWHAGCAGFGDFPDGTHKNGPIPGGGTQYIYFGRRLRACNLDTDCLNNTRCEVNGATAPGSDLQGACTEEECTNDNECGDKYFCDKVTPSSSQGLCRPKSCSFPRDSSGGLDPSWEPGTMYTHELGHVLGLRHEEGHPDWQPLPGTVPEMNGVDTTGDNEWCRTDRSSLSPDLRPITEFDTCSIMMSRTSECGGSEAYCKANALGVYPPDADKGPYPSWTDGEGVRWLYGPPAAWYALF